MTSEKILILNEDNFDDEIQKKQKPILVDFWAAWCGPCRMIAPTVEQIATDYEGRAVVGKVDVDSNRDTALKYDIRAIPTLLVFKNGEVADRIVGNVNKADIISKLDAVV